MTGERITNDDLPKGWIAADAVDCVHFCLVAITPGWILDFSWSLFVPIMLEAVHGYISTIKLTRAGRFGIARVLPRSLNALKLPIPIERRRQSAGEARTYP